MSVISYIKRCQVCDIWMQLTVDDKDVRFCPECLRDKILDAIAAAEDGDDYPLGGVTA